MSDAMAITYCGCLTAELRSPEQHNYKNHGEKLLIIHDKLFFFKKSGKKISAIHSAKPHCFLFTDYRNARNVYFMDT